LKVVEKSRDKVPLIPICSLQKEGLQPMKPFEDTLITPRYKGFARSLGLYNMKSEAAFCTAAGIFYNLNKIQYHQDSTKIK
jgi:hypothetical protein